MGDSGNPKEKADPKTSKTPASGEDFATLDGPAQVSSPAKEQTAKRPAPPKAENPDEKPAAKAPSTRVDPEALSTLDSAVALKTPITSAGSGSKQTPPPLDEGGTFVDATFGGASAPSGAGAECAYFIGPYQLVKLLDEGGMGQVWLAEQTEPVRRKVALKLIKGGRYDQSVMQRFASERQSLAIMDHPAISKVFDAGTTPDGQPFFVMEFVPGAPITQYCDQKRMSTRERLEPCRNTSCSGCFCHCFK